MHDPQLVYILDAVDQLLVEAARVVFLDARICNDKVEQLAAARVLHHEVQLLGRLDDLRV